MQKKIKVIGAQGGSYFIEQAISSNFSDTLGGEMTLSFTVKMRDLPSLTADDTLMYDGQYFVISSFTRSISNGEYLISVEAEHESFVLSDEDMDLDGFAYSGSVIGALNRILSGTDMVGAVGYATDSVSFDKTGSVTRRYLLNELVALCGGELEYSGHTVAIVEHRGQTSRYDILEKCPSADLTVTSNVQDDTVSYWLLTDGDSFAGASVGDEVRIKVGGSFAIDANVRIISVGYDIYNCAGVTIQLGDYQPDITDSIIDNDERYDEIEKSLSDYAKRSDVSAAIDTYINSDTGRASIVSSLSGTYVTESDLDGYVDKTTLSAEIGAYIDTQAGTAKIVNALSGTFVKEDHLGNYVEKTELSAEIGAYIDTAAGTAKIVSAASGTYQKKSDMNNYVTTTTLNTSISQYLDTSAGKAKIVSAVSGTYVTQSDLSGYAKTTAVTSIEQSVSSLDSRISLTASYGSNTIGSNVRALLTLVTNADSSSIKLKADAITIDGSLYLKSSDFLASGTTMIKGSKIQTSDLYIQQLRTSTGSYIMKYSATTLALGGGTSSSGDSFAQFSYIDIMAATATRFGYGTVEGGFYYENAGINLRPCTTYSNFNIGSSSYPVRYVYCDYLYVDGERVEGSSTSTTTTLKETDISKLYASSTQYIQLNSSKAFVANGNGFELGSATYPFQTLYIGNNSYKWTITSTAILPSSTSSSYFAIGSSSYPVQKLYAKQIYLNGTELTTGSSSSGSNPTKLYYSSSSTTYYVGTTSGYALVPSHCTSSYHWDLGSSSYYWYDCYIGYGSTRIGYSTSSKLGFFGTTPVTRQTVSSSATVATLITALKAYGLIG